MTRPKLILIIDDDPGVRARLTSALESTYFVRAAGTGEEGLEEFERATPDLVLLDVMLPQMGGLAVLRAMKRASPQLPVIMMTAYAEIPTAVQAIKLGALDYVQKPIAPDIVRLEIVEVLEGRARGMDSALASIVGQSPAIKRLIKAIERFAPTDIPILLQGETGTGKSVIAHAIHRLSKRASENFIAIDCATIPADLAESELFGYEDGAFTGAGKKKRGRVGFADRGTLFFDEIGTLALGTQAKLLTLIEQQQFLPLGARNFQPTSIDARFISATNVPLDRAVEDGSFRADLYHRINGIALELPPLRQREGDIEALARHFVAEFGRRQGKPDIDITTDALASMQQYAWPGNVRELQRVVSAAVVLAGTSITVEDLPDHVRTASAPPARPAAAMIAVHAAADLRRANIDLTGIKEWAGREAQKLVITELQKRGNITRQELARTLGLDPKTLRSRLREISGT